MRQNRLVLSLVLMVGPVAAGLTACGGDDGASSGGGTPDASSVTDASSATDASNNGDTATDSGAAPQAKASPVAVYLGHVANLDGSASTGPAGLTYTWTVGTAPAGSAVTTASLTGANTATPSFLPDLPGAYSLTLTVTAGTATSSTNVVVETVDPPVFFFEADDGAAAAGYRAHVKVVGAGVGDAGKPVGCFSSDAGTLADRASSAAGRADWWEAPPGQPSRVAFQFETSSEDGGATTLFVATTSTATCATPPAILDTAPGSATDTRTFEHPRFSPNGSRIAYLRNDPQGYVVATIGFDGSSARNLSAYAAHADGGPNPEAGPPVLSAGATGVGVRPVWVDDNTVAWVQSLDADHWQIVRAPDAANGSPTLVMSCAGKTPTQFDLLPGGQVIVSQNVLLDGGGSNDSETNIFVYAIDPATKACNLTRNISQRVAGEAGSNGFRGAYAFDFSLSPDKTHVAYRTSSENDGPREVFVARVDGTTPPRSIASPLSGAEVGPRWVGGGAFITWAIAGRELDAGHGGTVIAVHSSDGGTVRAAAASAPGNSTFAISNGGYSCTFAPAVGSGVSLFGVAGILALRLVRRRRR